MFKVPGLLPADRVPSTLTLPPMRPLPLSVPAAFTCTSLVTEPLMDSVPPLTTVPPV
ncbi:hypothetical protein D3C81_632580 [compost metagenome]